MSKDIRSKVQLISMDYIYKRSPVPDNVNADVIQSMVFEAQEMYIETKLGTDLYEDILQKVYDGSITGSTNETILLENYIQPALLWNVLYMSVLNSYIKTTNKGMNKLTSEYSESSSKDEIMFVRNSYKEYADNRMDRLYSYLLANESSFPLYSTNDDVDDIHPGGEDDFDIIFD